MPDALPFFVTLYRNGANPGLADWPQDEQRARAALLLDVIEAAKAEFCAIGGPIAWSPWEIDIGVADAREWLKQEGVPVPAEKWPPSTLP